MAIASEKSNLPTKPFEKVLYRELSISEARDLIDRASTLLREIVNYSTNALVRCQAEASGEPNEDVAIFMLYYHMIEMTDAVEILVSQCAPAPAVLQIRSIFEALLSLEYILETDYTRRSLAWLAENIFDQVRAHDRLDPTTELGKEYAAAFKVAKRLRNLEIPSSVRSEALRISTRGREILAKDEFAEIQTEIAKHKRRPTWYHLFGGPNDLRHLARALRREADYLTFYGRWSRTVHAKDLFRMIGEGPGEHFVFNRIRDPNLIVDVTRDTATMMLDATMSLLAKFRPGEYITTWYEREVRDLYLSLAGH